MKTAIIIPVYNHATRIVWVIEAARPLGLPIIVVNDGSTDNTGNLLEHITGITLLHHPKNQGKGAALLTGFATAHELGCSRAVTIDGDGQHDPADVPKLIETSRDRHPCLVIGCRHNMNRLKHVPWTSRFGRGFSNFWVRAAGGPQVRDSQSGFRLYPLPETPVLNVRARRYQFEVEVLVRAKQAGIPVLETPVSVIYQAERISHFQPWTDFHRNSVTFSRLLFERLVRVFLP